MNIRKVFLTIALIGLGYWLFVDYNEVRYLMKKYPEPFHTVKQDFSLIRFYNTYKTLSFANSMVQRNAVSSICHYLSLDEKDIHLIKLISEEQSNYIPARKQGNKPYIATGFHQIGATCISKSKLTHFEFKNNEAHATFSCEKADLVKEFSYSSSDGGKCGVIEYKKQWGIKPVERTLGYTTTLKIF